MVGKLTTVLTKKEAETYCAQGLHKEALGLYKNLLSSSPNLGDSFKSAIQGQVDSLQSELHDDDPNQENQMLSAAEIKRIREGWGANATEADILVCTKAFCQVGHYEDALPELIRLLQKGCCLENTVGLLAECLAHLRTPEQLLKTIGPLGKKTIDKLETRCKFYLLLTEEMVNQEQPDHALALFEFLEKDPVISKKAPQRLATIAGNIKQLMPGEIEPDPGETADPDEAAADENTDSADDGNAETAIDENDVTTAASDTEALSEVDNAETASTDDSEPPSPKSKKNPFGWLSFFKKRVSSNE